MPLVKPAAPPGFISQATQAQASGAWFAGNLVRWRTSLLEKISGWRRLINAALPGIIRRLHAWLDLDNRKNLLVASDDGVHIVIDSTMYPLGSGIDLQGGFIPVLGTTPDATKFSVALGATEVTVKIPITLNVGQEFFLKMPISIGGRIILAGSYFKVKSVVLGTGFTFDMPQAALAAETDTYGVPLFTNDFVNGITVTWKAHGFAVGAQIRIAQTTTLQVGAAGVWEQVSFSAAAGTVGNITSVPDADHLTFNMGPFGTGDGTGGPSHQVYLGSSIQYSTSGGGITATAGSVIGVVVPEPFSNPQRQAWFLGNMGKFGLALASGGPLRLYTPPIADNPFLSTIGVGPPATAPQQSNGFIVAMPQAQVILFGTEVGTKDIATNTTVFGDGVVDPLLIRYSNVGTYDEYTATVSNQAGSFRLSRGSRIVGMIQAPQATLIFTDTDCWQMTYIGPPLIYGFTIMGSGCGLAAPHAVATLGRMTIWQGQKNFWMFDTGVQPLPCSVWDYIFTDMDTVNLNKCHAAPNSTTNEMGFYFPSRSMTTGLPTNLLLFSQEFGKWILTNVIVTRLSLAATLYVYEPQYLNSGWFDDNGLGIPSWLDRDLGAKIEDIIYAPDGTDTALAIVETPINDTHSVSQLIEKVRERTTYTFSVYAHSSSTRNMTISAGNAVGSAYATFNVATGNILSAGVTSPSFALVGAKMVLDELGSGAGTGGNGWRRYVLSFTSDDSSEFTVFINVTNGTTLNYLGVPPNHILVWGAQLVLGGDPLAYEQTSGRAPQNEARHYVKVNVAEGMAWDSGILGRSAWLDESIWGFPLGGDITPKGPPCAEHLRFPPNELPPPRNLIQQHGIGYDDDGEPMTGVFAETGYTELGDGTALMLVDQVHPDMKWFGLNGGVKISLRAANYPQGPSHLYGPWSMTPGTQWFNPHVRARYVAVRYDWEPLLGFSARVGVTTFHVKPAGRLP
jgi:hypothetical protein